jgi:type I restriction enzyme S subunit
VSEWPKVRFGDLFQIKHGFAFKGEHFSDEPGPVVLTPGNFEAGGGLKLRPGKDRSYDGEFPEAFKLKVGELLVVMTDLTQEAAILGAPAFVSSDIACLHNQRLGKIVDLKTDRLDLRFLYYLCNTHEYREYLRSTATGSTVKHTSPGRICDFPVSLPPIETQRRIAGILGAYDDLIQVNRRRITVLEEMARGLFTEWFTRLRFPGHEDAAIEDTPDGPLPAGWCWGRFADLASEVRDTVLPEAVDPAMPYVGLEHISRRSTTLAEHGAAAEVSSLKARFRRGDILFGKIRPYFHKVAAITKSNLPTILCGSS